MKKSFTLAETLVTLTVLGVIMAIVMPLINKAKPDKDIMIFKKGMYTIQSVVGNATELLLNQGALSNEIWKSAIVIDDTNFGEAAEYGFCSRLADQLNTSKVDCGAHLSGTYENPQIITTDGIRYWNLPILQFGSDVESICFDRTFSDKELSVLEEVREGYSNQTSNGAYCDVGGARPVGLKVDIRWDGKVFIPHNNANYAYENSLVEKSFQVQKDES